MTTRQMRRAIERREVKEQRKAMKAFRQERLSGTTPFLADPTDLDASTDTELGPSEPAARQRETESASNGKNRIEANRANAQLSTGPRTPGGKAVSSQNATKHGLYSKAICLPGENPAELEALKAKLTAEHQPGTETEAILVSQLAENAWRLRRAQRLEAELCGTERELSLWNAIQRLHSSADRGLHRALNALRRVQKERGFVPQKPAAQPAPEPKPAPKYSPLRESARELWAEEDLTDAEKEQLVDFLLDDTAPVPSQIGFER